MVKYSHGCNKQKLLSIPQCQTIVFRDDEKAFSHSKALVTKESLKKSKFERPP